MIVHKVLFLSTDSKSGSCLLWSCLQFHIGLLLHKLISFGQIRPFWCQWGYKMIGLLPFSLFQGRSLDMVSFSLLWKESGCEGKGWWRRSTVWTLISTKLVEGGKVGKASKVAFQLHPIHSVEDFNVHESYTNWLLNLYCWSVVHTFHR